MWLTEYIFEKKKKAFLSWEYILFTLTQLVLQVKYLFVLSCYIVIMFEFQVLVLEMGKGINIWMVPWILQWIIMNTFLKLSEAES
jgi:hypothetical protein